MAISKSEYAKRLGNVRAALEKKGLKAMLVARDENIRYLTGSDSGRIFVSLSDSVHWTSPIYEDLLKNSPIPWRGIKEKKEIRNFLLKTSYKKIGVDEMYYSSLVDLRKKIKKSIQVLDVIEDLRKIKSKAEIELLEKSARIASGAMEKVGLLDVIGMTEFELAAEVEYEIRKNGSETAPFGKGIICLSGPNTKYIHGFPSNRKIEEGDLVMLDIGAVYDGYNSDMTRTLEVGRVGKEKKDIADFVKALKESAIDKIYIGGRISEIHGFIEKQIEKKGYKFLHLSGHGIGLEIHEKPSISPEEKDVFQKGMAFTIEPGIYTGAFGARSEDSIVLDNRKKIITQLAAVS
ncbi:MAG: aminopeptidase P family protein [Candidatus Altiarchaeota archaeon]|nr:aminopeptidase P family protein [Candidatus Altiarchaeota archaeon]